MVDVGIELGHPWLDVVLSTVAVEEVVGCCFMVVCLFLGSGVLFATMEGGPSGYGGLVMLTDAGLRVVSSVALLLFGPIVDLVVFLDGERVVVVCAWFFGGAAHAFAMWNLHDGALVAGCDLLCVVSAIVFVGSDGALVGFFAGVDGTVLWWMADRGMLMTTLVVYWWGMFDVTDLGMIIGLAVLRDGCCIYIADWVGGVLALHLVDPDGVLWVVDRFALGGCRREIGDAEGACWDEMICAAGRWVIAGSANLTLTLDDWVLIVTNGMWVDIERWVYLRFCFWFLVVHCGDDGELTLDWDRVMTIVNRPSGFVRYGQTCVSWVLS